MVHGGCWQTEIADRRIMNWIADDLRKRGIAVWNIDYRGVDRTGGGYPGTFLDAAAAADALRDHAGEYQLDISRWSRSAIRRRPPRAVAGRPAPRCRRAHSAPPLPRSPLLAADPLPIDSVVSLGGLPDLEEAARPPGSGCGTEVIALVGPPTPTSATSMPTPRCRAWRRSASGRC
jgi:hypothetical protein